MGNINSEMQIAYNARSLQSASLKCLTSRRPPVWEIAVHLAVACDV